MNNSYTQLLEEVYKILEKQGAFKGLTDEEKINMTVLTIEHYASEE